MFKRRFILFCFVYRSKKEEQFLHKETPSLIEYFDDLFDFTESNELERNDSLIKTINIKRKLHYYFSIHSVFVLIHELLHLNE